MPIKWYPTVATPHIKVHPDPLFGDVRAYGAYVQYALTAWATDTKTGLGGIYSMMLRVH
jgi:hypothetical protein